ncbi:MAG TPA: hypothetical protein VKB12_08180, partial [Pyrinomonadaceae bacterium]|nr:hypothetical protein [Pyrinomonadaceae bacterium]
DLFNRVGVSDVGVGALVYWDSFILKHPDSFTDKPPRLSVAADKVTISGEAKYAESTKTTSVVVEVPRAGEKPTATVTITRENGSVEGTFKCEFASPHFREVEYEIDMMEGTEVFGSYDTSLLAPGRPRRVLSIDSAYAEAGVEMRRVGDEPGVVSNIPESDPSKPDGKWSDTELHDSMMTQFSLIDTEAQKKTSRQRQWRLWLFVANKHEQDLRGVMFDSHWDRARQGCAVFYDAIKGEDPHGDREQRAALRTYVHEVGHCLNLAHSWEKHMVDPPREDRRDSLSYMNYVDEYPDGEEAYWDRFGFEFDDEELFHLRHAFRNNIIMGGRKFGVGGAELAAPKFRRQPEHDSGLELKLQARETFVMCEPVVVELKLRRKGDHVKRVHPSVHPDRGFVRLAIRKPGGRVVSYRPFSVRCAESGFTFLNAEQPSIYASAYVGYGKDGFYFDQAGFYQIVAVYRSPCGSEVVSEPCVIQVRNPLDKAEEEIAYHYYGDDQGALFYMLGSDSKSLSSGNRSLDNVLEKYGRHPLSVHAQLVKGVNVGRNFKTITAEKKLALRPPDAKECRDMLAGVIEASTRGAGFFRQLLGLANRGRRDADGPVGAPRIDNITLNMCARRLARAHRRLGDQARAAATLKAVAAYFRSNGLKGHVMRRIEAQAARTLEEEF